MIKGYVSPEEKNYPRKIIEHLNYQVEGLVAKGKNRESSTLQSLCPKPLYYKGDLSLTGMKSIGIVGSRKCSSYGIAVTRELTKLAVSYGAVVISGLARGIDYEAHKTALKEGGKTIALLGCGLDVYYPGENKDLQKEIGEKGLLLSEYPSGTEPEKYYFPMRNRLISALSDAVVVVEAKTRSGSLITAEAAIEQGKSVYAVPGNITGIYSMGPNKLIRDGANPLVFLDDVFSDMGLKKKAIPMAEKLNEGERMVVEYLSERGEVPLGEMADNLSIEMWELNSIVTFLEIKGIVFCEMGKVMIANSL